MTEHDWRKQHAAEAEKAMKHPLAQKAMREFAGNMRFDPDSGLPAYGLAKVMTYVAQVARAQALGIDPEMLRMSDDEIRSAQLELAAEAAYLGVPLISLDPAALPGTDKENNQ